MVLSMLPAPSGKIIAKGVGEELLNDEVLRKTYLGF
jgi:ABC-type lipopolysaccharide export system ATPase subunit